MKAQSIRSKLLAAMFATSVSALVLAGVTLLVYELSAYKRTTGRNLTTLAQAIAANSSALLVYGDEKTGREVLSALRSEPNVVAAALYDGKGHLYVTYPAGLDRKLFPAAPGPDGLQGSGLQLQVFEPVMQSGGRLGTLFVQEDLTTMYNRFAVYAAVLVLVLAGCSAVAFLLANVFQQRLSGPILALAGTARRISEEKDFAVRAANPEGPEELMVLNRTFNEMLEQIHSRDLSLQKAQLDLRKYADELEARVHDRTESLEETTRQLYDFCYSIAHDLKAPIRAQAAYARILLEDFGPQIGPEASGYVSRILDAAERQSRLVSDLLAHVSLGRSDLPMVTVDLALTSQRVGADLRHEVERQNAVLDHSAVRGLVVANPASLHLIVLNLVSNGLKFVQPGKPAEVRLWTEPRGELLRLWVEDKGIGIPSQHLQKVFAMFQRLHTRDQYPGTGIGLAIVKRAAERMGGQVGVESTPGEGSRFWVELPSAHSPASHSATFSA